MAKKAKVVKEKSIEDRIWDSANKLRGNLTASEYQNVVLGLVFLKYISDCFEKRYNELVEEGQHSDSLADICLILTTGFPACGALYRQASG